MNWNGFQQDFKKGMHDVEMSLPFLYVFPGQYYITIWIKQQGKGVEDQISNAIEFTVIESHMNGNKTDIVPYKNMNFTLPSEWKILRKHE